MGNSVRARNLETSQEIGALCCHGKHESSGNPEMNQRGPVRALRRYDTPHFAEGSVDEG